MERYSFHIVSGDSRFAQNYAKTVPFHKISTPGDSVKLRYFSQWVIETMFVYHFVNPEMRFEKFFEKEGAKEFGGSYSEIYTCHTLVLWFEENFMCLLFYIAFLMRRKKQLSKAILTCACAIYHKSKLVRFSQ